MLARRTPGESSPLGRWFFLPGPNPGKGNREKIIVQKEKRAKRGRLIQHGRCTTERNPQALHWQAEEKSKEES